MGFFRFRRSVKLFPGVRLNLSRSGVSTSIGRPGAWFTIGPRGTRTTIGIPGTGLSYTEQSTNHAGHATEPIPVAAAYIPDQLVHNASDGAFPAPNSPEANEVEPVHISGARAFLVLAIVCLIVVVAFWAFG